MIPNKPSNVIWTDEQWQAIYESGKNILVSAGAGSGKTAVLTERLKEKVVSGISLKELIVLTFTKDAATSMKERLRKSLTKAFQSEQNEIIKKQIGKELNEIDEAHIQTFDSYTAFLVKKYHYLLGLPQNVNMIDEGYLRLKKKEIIEHIIDEEFNHHSEDIVLLCNLFTVKDTNRIVKALLSLCNKMELIIDQETYLNNYFDYYFTDKANKKIIDAYFQEIMIIIKEIGQIWNRDYRLKEEKAQKFYGDCVDSLRPLLNLLDHTELNNYEKYEYLKKHFSKNLPRSPRKAESQEISFVANIKERTSKLLKKIESFLEYEKLSDLIDEYQKSKDTVKALINILKKVTDEETRFKKRINSYTFMDIAKFAISLLEQNEDIRLQIKNDTKEILIDEYQDTSDVQEKLINMIANNNVYMVGDIKQSIYQFRNANPKIFQEKYQKYKQEEGGIVIDLMKNFRSREEVLSDINHIFKDLMSSDYGGVNYTSGHELIFGNMAYSSTSNERYRMVNLTYDKDLLTNYSKMEAEAFIIGQDIKRRMSSEKILKKNELVNPSYGDFAILSSATSCHEIFAKVFRYLGIPYAISSKSSFIRSEEIYFIKSMLECSYCLISNEFYQSHYDIALLSILRSFVILKSDDEIHKLFTNEISLKELDQNLYDKLYKYAKMMESTPLSDIVLEIYRDFDIYLQLVKLGNISQREQKLMFFYQKAKEFQSLKIIDFLNYLDEVKNDEKVDIEYNQKQESCDSVSIITIHKSKGLEYPICYVVDLEHDFNLMDINTNILFSQEYGIITPIFDNGLKNIITKRLYQNEYIKSTIGEKIRLYYVALTRAKEKIIFVSPKLKKNEDELDDYLKAKCRSFYDFNNAVYDVLSRYTIEVDVINCGLSKNYLKNVDRAKQILKNELKNNNKKYIQMENKNEKINKSHFSKTINEIITLDEYKKLEIGKAFHQALEYASVLEKTNPYQNILVDKFINHPFIKSHVFINEYHEYPFIDHNNQKGVIDLILETADEIYIIDYKLRNVNDEAYLNQLSKYEEYLKTITSKKINKYLYSIFEQKFVYLPEMNKSE